MRSTKWVAAALAAMTPIAVAASGNPTIQSRPRSATDFAQLPLVANPILSPDGKLIAGRLGIKGEQYFAIIPVDGSPPRFIPTEGSDLNWWQWVNDEWLIIGVGGRAPFGQVGEAYIRRAIGIRADGQKSVQLITKSKVVGQNADNLIWRASDGSPRVYLSLQRSIYSHEAGFWPEVVEFDVSTGASKLVTRAHEGIFNWVADGNGVVRMGYGYSLDGRTTRILYRDADDEAFNEFALLRRGDEEKPSPDLFLKDGRAISFSPDDEGFMRVYEFDLATMALGKSLYASSGFDVGAIIASRDKSSLVGVRFAEDRDRVTWIDPELITLQREIDGMVQSGQASIHSFDDARQRAIVAVGANDSPGAYYLYDRPAGSMTLLSHSNPALKLARLNPVETIRYKARDGLEIAAVLTRPKGRTGPSALIVMPHGGPYARDSEGWDWWAQFLADRGYVVVQPNYRGSSGYGTAFAKKGEGQWGLAMQDDLNDAVAHLAEAGVIDPNRVCIMGASYGGYAAVRAVQRDPSVYRCAVSYAGVFDLNKLMRYDRRFLFSGARSDWMSEQAPDLSAVSTINLVSSVDQPVLLFHGKEDRVVPVDQSRDMAKRLRGAGKDVTYVEQAEADHHFSRSADRLEFLEAVEKFLNEHNPA